MLLLALVVAAAPLSQQIDSILSPLADRTSPGLAVLVRSHGRTIFQRGYGVRDLRTLHPIDSQTNFRLASCTKQFTAMAVMLLVHDGRLRYDRTLTEIFPEFPAYGRAITVRHLLTHTSGLADYEPLWTSTNQVHDGDVLRLLERQTGGKFPPGSSWSYSNSGYVLLGLVVAKISGQPFDRFLHDRVFAPLHMTNTLAYINGENTIPNRAYGHTKGPNGFTETDQSPTSATLGDGGVYSNLSDLAKWDDALDKHALLSKEEMTGALTPVRLADGRRPTWPLESGDDNLAPGRPVSYGFGWFLDPWRGRPRTWHFGSTAGFRTAIERFTGGRLTVVILANRTDLAPDPVALQLVPLILKTEPRP